jgi:hypothetical protein
MGNLPRAEKQHQIAYARKVYLGVNYTARRRSRPRAGRTLRAGLVLCALEHYPPCSCTIAGFLNRDLIRSAPGESLSLGLGRRYGRQSLLLAD